jgi:DNA helicase HerA-like ATPase
MINLAQGVDVPARYLNRHALITGPTGTGKTVSILRLVDQCRTAGIPVLIPDVKGDLWTLHHNCGARILRPRIPVWSIGADMLARILDLTDVQAGNVEIALARADEIGAPLDTIADFRRVLMAISADPDSVAHLGHVTRASCGTVQRALLRLRDQGTFAAPAIDVTDILAPGVTLIPAESMLRESPRVYAAVLLWTLRELARRLQEQGDAPKPRLVFVFDEAHTLFSDASQALVRSLEQTARLIRSKGVGIVFASQSPSDIPAIIAAQCATRVEHSRELGVGRAKVVTLSGRGEQMPARTVRISPPSFPLTAAAPIEDVTAPAVVKLDKPSSDFGWLITLAVVAIVVALALWYVPTGWLIAAAIGTAIALR